MFLIGNVSINSPLVLAPMAGISDLPYRLINRPFGCSLAFTEMIDAGSLTYKSENSAKRLSSSPDDRLLGVQIAGGAEDMIQRALDILSKHQFDIIDFNAACPVKRVVLNGHGAGLLRDPVKLQKLMTFIVRNSAVPVTVKIRSGWNKTSVNAVETALRAQDAGVSGLFIHGRTRMQGYTGNVDYDIIRKVKEALKIPVIASGDALTPRLIKALFDNTGCDGVAVARGALGNPWIFSRTNEFLKSGVLPPGPDAHEITQTMKEHLASNISIHGEETGVFRFRPFFSWYTRGMTVKKLKALAFRAVCRDEMVRLIDEVQTLPAAGDNSSLREIAVKYNQLPG